MSSATTREDTSSRRTYLWPILFGCLMNMNFAGGFVQPARHSLSPTRVSSALGWSGGLDGGLARGPSELGCAVMSSRHSGGEGQSPRSSWATARLYLEDGRNVGPDRPVGKIGHAGGKVGAGARVPTEADSVGGGGDDGPGGGDSKDVGGAGGGQGSGGGDDDGDGDKSGDEAGGEIEIAAEGRRREKIVRKVDRAISRGKVPKEFAQAYANLLQWPLTSLLCKNSGWRARLLGDNTFVTKIAIELVTGTVSQVLAEYQKRGKKFMMELEFVMADVLTCLFANFAAVWLSCPTVVVGASKRGAAKAGGALQEFLTSCPSNAFQKIAKTSADGGAVQGISMYQRGAALVIPMPKLFVIGFGATIGGYGLIAALEIVNKWRRERSGELQLATADAGSSGRVNVMGSGLAIGAFLAVSTNVRYQFIAGALEQRVFDTMLATKPHASGMASMAVRSANLYFGSLTIVDWLRCVGLQHELSKSPLESRLTLLNPW